MSNSNTVAGRVAKGTLTEGFRLAGVQVVSTARSIVSVEAHELMTAIVRERAAMQAPVTTLAGLTDGDIDSLIGAL